MRILYCFLIYFITLTILNAQNSNIETVLDTNGNIKTNINGSFDATGYRMVLDGNNAPTFRKENDTQTDYTWNSFGTGSYGVNSSVTAIAVNGTDVYVGGSFSSAGDIVANYIAKWDGTGWSKLGVGVAGSVYCIAVSGTDVYVGGNFTLLGDYTTSAKYIAKWNGSSWSALGTGLGGSVFAIAINGTDVYAGGGFTTLGNGTSAKRIAKWDGTTWSALGVGLGGNVVAIGVYGTTVYAGGSFTTLGSGADVKYFAKWDGTAWSSSRTFGGGVNEIVINGTDMYVGGGFSYGINKCDLTTNIWNIPGGYGVDGGVSAIVVIGNDVYVGGNFSTINNYTIDAKNIAKWNTLTSTWSAVEVNSSKGFDGFVNSLGVNNSGELYAAGEFTMLDDNSMELNYIAKYSSNQWYKLGSGNNGVSKSSINSIAALAIDGANIYVGGLFSFAGGIPAKNIAKWDGSNWSALGDGLESDVSSLAIISGNLYAGGYFTTLGDGTTSANYIAKWDGSSWSTLGTGFNNYVTSLAVNGSDLYAGGAFTTAGGSSANMIAKWDGSAWSTLGTGFDGLVNAICIDGTSIYAGGSFLNAGGSGANNIAKWDGSVWSALGTGLGGTVNAIAVIGSDIYAGGWFTTLGDGITTAKQIAKYNGSVWSDIGSELNRNVNALTVKGTNLYIGGRFSFASTSGKVFSFFALYKNSVWDNLGNTVGGEVRVLYPAAGLTEKIYLGGKFHTLNYVNAAFKVGSFEDNTGLPVCLNSFNANVIDNEVFLNWATTTEIDNYGFEIERNITDTNWEKLGFVSGSGNSNVSLNYSFIDKTAPAGLIKYRLKQINNSGSFEYSNIILVNTAIPYEFILKQNYPNPFNPSTTISFEIPKEGKVTLKIYDVLGKEITTLVDEFKASGKYNYEFNASQLASGMYIYKLTAGDFVSTKKLMLLK